MTATLFDLAADAAALARTIDAAAADLLSDDPEEAAAAALQLEELITSEASNREAMLAKADSWAWVIAERVSRAETRLEHARRLEALAERDTRQAEEMKARLISALLQLDPHAVRFDLPRFRISSRRSQAVELDYGLEVADLPPEFQRQRISISADKTAIKEALQAGRVVPGAILAERRTWKLS